MRKSTHVVSFSVRGGVDNFAAFMNRIDGIVKDNLENFLIFYRQKPENTYRNSQCEAWEVYKFACYATVEAHEIVSGTTVIDCWNGKKPHQNYPTYAIKQEEFLNFCHWLFEQARVSGLEPKQNFLIGDTQESEDTEIASHGSYDLGKVLALLRYFTKEELLDYCFTTPSFQPIYEELEDIPKPDSIRRHMLDYADRKGLVPELLAWAKAANPTRYAEGQPYETNQLTD